MARKTSKKKSGVFISHASANLTVAQEIEAALQGKGFEVWLDRTDIRAGVLLGKELQLTCSLRGQV